jgi:hypothetical protein
VKFRASVAAAIVGVAVALSGCPGQVSDNPEIALKQEWSAACSQLKTGVLTALMLGQAGKLTEAEAQVIDKVNVVYVETCAAEPVALTEALQNALVIAAVGELCPELTPSDDVVLLQLEASA